MTTNRKLLFCFVGLGAFVLVVGLLLPLFARTSNCGGNSYALTACKQIGLSVQEIMTTNSPLSQFNQFDPDNHTNLLRLSDSHWTPGASYWLRTNGFSQTTQKQIIVFCDTIYANVPQPTIWNFYRRNPAYAVGFSDGSTGLISPPEFIHVDRDNFLNLTTLGKAAQP